jgi:DNA-binding PadR family transcriptional regulator
MSFFGIIKNLFTGSSSGPKKIEKAQEDRSNPPSEGPDVSDIGIVFRNPDTMAVEDNIKNAIPSNRGLLPNELKLLEQANRFKNKDNHFQAYWKYQYGFNDVQGALTKLEKEGFITAANFEETLQKGATVSQLKQILKDHGEKLTGKKADLIVRILSLNDVEDIEKRFDNRPYRLTPKGEAELEENNYIKSPFFTVWELNQWVHEQPGVDWKDIVEKKLIEEGSNYQLYLWFLDKKEYLKSFRYLLKVVREQIEEFSAFSPSYYGLPDRDEEKFDSDIQILMGSLQGVYIPKLMYFQSLFSLDENKFKELVRRELEFDKAASRRFPTDVLLAFIFGDERKISAFLNEKKKKIFRK